MVNTLHEQLLRAVELDEEDNHAGFGCRSLGAVRAVVELHAPFERYGEIFCAGCSPRNGERSYHFLVAYSSCQVALRVASALGVETS